MIALLRDWSLANRIAFLALALACGTAVVTAVSVALLQPLDEPPLRPDSFVEPDRVPRQSFGNGQALLQTVAHNPFRPDRKRANGRYQDPRSAASADAAEARQPLPQVRLVGTAVRAGGEPMVALVVNDAPPRIVHLGDDVGGLEVVEVAAGSVTLAGRDTTLLLELSSPIETLSQP